MHSLVETKTKIFSELRIEPWTFRSQEDAYTKTYISVTYW